MPRAAWPWREIRRARHTGAYTRLRARLLRDEPLCRQCAAEGRTSEAAIMDHIIPMVDRADLALSPSNVQPLCEFCHDAKSAAERAARPRRIIPPLPDGRLSRPRSA